ncbi:hypothetical protein SLEP1_g55160 [Rubroshorea leprosula]|uniref:Uncharacterized protein n=1 Tax=Rubroshorea leprosula TaxID=152421 RepID=A0AAV5MIC5_9ROSI|nr:hypothetical protein SLEP1_g55160 [Rubroshorea leprosula]
MRRCYCSSWSSDNATRINCFEHSETLLTKIVHEEYECK